MISSYIDIHPHIISGDTDRYPRAPLFGKQSDWSKERPVTVAELIAEMDAAGVDKAAVVQSSTCYGFDNSYVTDCVSRHPERLTAVGSVDVLAPDAPKRIREWMARGVSGLRLFTGGTTKAFDPGILEDPRSYPTWELCGEAGLSMCVQTGAVGLPQVTALAKRFPTVKIILDHAARPDVTDGPPYANAGSLFALAEYSNIYLKLTPRIFTDQLKGSATAETLFPLIVKTFGANRLAWGSNFPASEGTMGDNLEIAKRRLACLSDKDRGWVFAKTAQILYPRLAD